MAAPVQESGGGKSLAEELADVSSKKTSDDDGWPTAVNTDDTPKEVLKTSIKNDRQNLPSRHKKRKMCVVYYLLLLLLLCIESLS